MPPARRGGPGVLALLLAGVASASRVAYEAPSGAPASLPGAVRTLRWALSVAPAEGGGTCSRTAIKDALAQAQLALDECSADSAECPSSFEPLIEACADAALAPGCGQPLPALSVLAALVASPAAGAAHLRGVVRVCGEVAATGAACAAHLLRVVQIVARRRSADEETALAAIRIAMGLVTSTELPEGWPERTRYLFDIMTAVAALSPSHEQEACRCIGEAAMATITAMQVQHSFFSSTLLLQMLVHGALPHGSAQLVLLDILGIVELCADRFDDTTLASVTGDVALQLALRLDTEHLGRVVDVCMRPSMAPRRATGAALDALGNRLLAEVLPRDRGPEGLRLLARTFELPDRPVSADLCTRVVQHLRRCPLPEPLSCTFWRAAAPRAALPPELLLHIGGLVPPSPGEGAVAAILGACARRAGRRAQVARSVLQAACLAPRRVGMEGALAFAALARDVGAGGLDAALHVEDFLHVGECLRDAGRVPGCLREADALHSRRIAHALLEAAVPVMGGWSAQNRRSASRALCAVAASPHVLCKD